VLPKKCFKCGAGWTQLKLTGQEKSASFKHDSSMNARGQPLLSMLQRFI